MVPTLLNGDPVIVVNYYLSDQRKKTHCYYPDTNTLEKSRYCPGKLVTLEEGEALVKQGN